MADEILRKPTGAHVKLGTFVLLIILVAIAFGGAGLLYGINAGKAITATKTATATASATSSKTATASATATDVTANWKTYTNESLGFSFKYPNTMSIKDTLNPDSSKNVDNKVVLTEGANSLSIWINPDGFGPFFPDKSYLLGKSGNGIKISQTTNGTDDNSKTDGQYMVIGTYESNVGIVPYFIAKNTDNDNSIDSLFKQILSTFQFTK